MLKVIKQIKRSEKNQIFLKTGNPGGYLIVFFFAFCMLTQLLGDSPPEKTSHLKSGISPYWSTSKDFVPFFSDKGKTLDNKRKELSYTVKFKAVPKKTGYTVVLGYRSYLTTPEPAGWRADTSLTLNGKRLRKITTTGEYRLLRRGAYMDTSLKNNPKRDWWQDGLLNIFFGNGIDLDPKLKNARSEGYNFLFDISDAVNYVEIGADDRIEKARDNVLLLTSIFNPLRYKRWKGTILYDANAKFENIVIGYIPNSALNKMRPADDFEPLKPSAMGKKKFTVEKKNYKIHLFENGSFEICCGKTNYYVQDSFSYPAKPKMHFTSFAAGIRPKTVSVEKNKDNKVFIRSRNAFFDISRELDLSDNCFIVKDTVKNISGKTQGMKIYFTVMSSVKMPYLKTFISGLNQKRFQDGMCGQNPTFFVDPEKGGSLGIYVYDDLLRNQSAFYRTNNKFILADSHIGFPATGKESTKVFIRRFYPAQKAGYFDFVNQVRHDLKLNRRLDGPMKFGAAYRRVPKTKHHTISGWFEWNPTSPWEGRRKYKQKALAQMKKLKEKNPEAKVLGKLESNIVSLDTRTIKGGEKLPQGCRSKGGGVYGLVLNAEQNKILHDSPYSDSIMRNADGYAVIDTSYAKAPYINLLVHFADGNYRLKNILEQIDYLLDDVGLDGVYCDQFVPGCDRALDNDKRCSYDKWDNNTVDLKPDGTIERKIYDYIIAGSPARAAIVRHVAAKGKIMYNNNHPVTVETNGLPSYSFCESGGPTTRAEIRLTGKPPLMRCHAMAQLSGSPISLGPEIIPEIRKVAHKVLNRAAVIHLRSGVLFAYYHADDINPELGGCGIIDNMFPITPVKLGEGYIIGKERILTCISRKFVIKCKNKPIIRQFDNCGKLKINSGTVLINQGDSWIADIKLNDWDETAVVIIPE